MNKIALLILLLFICSIRVSAETDNNGYPKPVTFRNITPKLIPHMDWMQMVISDRLISDRQFSDEEFKLRYPDRPVLIQDGGIMSGAFQFAPKQQYEDLGMLDSEVLDAIPRLQSLKTEIDPITDFLGYWLYDAGADSRTLISANTEIVTIEVTDVKPFRPNTHPTTINALKETVGQDSYMKDVVICPRTKGGELEWLNAELATITKIDEAANTITVRRWKTSKEWISHDAGTYIAPNSNLMFSFNAYSRYNIDSRLSDVKVLKPFYPNLSRFCPKDPRTGLNAAEWLAKHYVEIKDKYYPNSDGFVFDVMIGTYYPSHRASDRIDGDNDGKIDNFFFDGINYWPLGMYDFIYYLRNGVDGKFEGLGQDALLAWDSNDNTENQRFFDLINGGEYEHSMLHPTPVLFYRYSSMLDRYLLWAERGRKPDVTFIHNKYPDEIYHGGNKPQFEPPYTLHSYRLDMATACMGSGYVGKQVIRGPGELPEYPGKQTEWARYGGYLPKDYDEYHKGEEEIRGWLGEPISDPTRIESHLGPVIYRFNTNSEMPTIYDQPAAKEVEINGRIVVVPAGQPWKAEAPQRIGNDTLKLTITSVGLWRIWQDSFNLRAELPLTGIHFERDQEYTISFKIRGTSPFKEIDDRYGNIPRNVSLRLNVNNQTNSEYTQEILVFEDERRVDLTLIAPASGKGKLHFGIAENTGDIYISGLEVRKGCADVMYREFEHGLVILNGSYSAKVTIPMEQLFPDRKYKRINGTQDPEHNNGKLVDPSLTLKKLDGIFLITVD
jgi:hypothetical protein